MCQVRLRTPVKHAGLSAGKKTTLLVNNLFFRGDAFLSEYLLRRTLKIALETAVLDDIEGLELLLRQFFRHLVRDPACIRKHIVLIELQEGIQLFNPIRSEERRVRKECRSR